MSNDRIEQLEPALATRLERLSNRNQVTTERDPRSSLDDELEARMARLAERRQVAEAKSSPARKTGPTRRRHPARKSRIAALTLSLMTTVGLTTRFVTTDSGNASVLAVDDGSASATAASTGLAASTGTAAAGTSSQGSAQTVSSPVVGDAYSNRFGVVQVQATFGSDGSLVDVEVVQAPGQDWRSARISNLAVPMLNSEALTVQSARVDSISGATYTSISYQQSLQSAIDIARSEGLTQLT